MSQLTMPALVYRDEKGAPLTIAEMDDRIRTISAFCNSLAALFGVAVNIDGSLIINAVGETNLQDRSVTLRKLAFKSAFFAKDTGTSNAYAIAFTPPCVAYENGQLFFVQAANDNTGGSTLKVDGLDAIRILKRGSLELESTDVKRRSVFAVVYVDGTFHLVASSGSSSSGSSDTSSTNFTGLTKYEPDDEDVPADGASVTFTHSLGQVPDMIDISLICTADDAGFTVGQRIPISNVTALTGEAGFKVTVDDVDIITKRVVASLYAASADALNMTNWQIHVVARKTYTEASNLFPALDIMSAWPDGALSYGQYLYWFARGKNHNKTYIHRLDMVTGQVLPPSATGSPGIPSENFFGVNPAALRFADGADWLVWTCSTGLYKMPLQDPGGTWAVTRVRVNGSSQTSVQSLTICKPIWYDETASPPAYYAAGSHGNVTGAGGNAPRLNAIPCRKIITSPSTSDTALTPLNLTTGYTNADKFQYWHPSASTAYVMLFQYNPVKKRIYVMTNETGLLHIFELTGSAGAYATNNISAWWQETAAARNTWLGYVKTIVVGGYGGAWTNYPSPLSPLESENIAVDFDLTSGQEKAICWTRGGGSGAIATPYSPGCVTRVPWREG